MADGFYRCDRCDTFEKGPQRRSSMGTDFSEEKYRKFKYGHRRGENNTGCLIATVDLCEDCRKELTEWIGNAAGVGPDPEEATEPEVA